VGGVRMRFLPAVLDNVPTGCRIRVRRPGSDSAFLLRWCLVVMDESGAPGQRCAGALKRTGDDPSRNGDGDFFDGVCAKVEVGGGAQAGEPPLRYAGPRGVVAGGVYGCGVSRGRPRNSPAGCVPDGAKGCRTWRRG